MAWKTDENGNIIKGSNGNPVYVFSDGEEVSVDYAFERQKINELNEKNKKNQAAKQSLETLYKLLGVENESAVESFVEKAKENEAIATDYKSQTGGKKITEVLDLEKAKSIKLETVIANLKKEIEDRDLMIAKNNITSKFAKSKFVTENIGDVILAEKLFAENFNIEDGKIVGYFNGEKILNDKGDPDFDFAIEKLVNESSFKDKILKAKGNGGSGSGGGNQYAGSADFSKMSEAEMMKFAKEHPEALPQILATIKNKK